MSDEAKPAKRARTASPEREGPASELTSLNLLLKAPLDILAEVCTHLPPADLLQLARTSKALRSFLLSKSGRAIWAASRMNSGWGIPSPRAVELSEVQLALFLFGSDSCQTCNTASSANSGFYYRGGGGSITRRDYSLMIRQCTACREKNLIAVSKVKRGLRSGIADLHPEAIECVPTASVSDPYAAYRRRGARPAEVLARRDLLISTNEKLHELVELDAQETEEREILQLRAKGSNSKKARTEVSQEWDLNTPHSARVEAFVAKRKTWADAYGVEGRKIEKARIKYENDLARQRREEQARETEQQRLKQVALKKALLDDGWSDELYQHWSSSRYGYWHGYGYGSQATNIPDSTPATDADYWAAAKAKTEESLAAQKERERVAAEQRALATRQSNRKAALTPFFNNLRGAEPKSARSTFPSLETFLAFNIVKILFWEKDDAVLDDKTWASALPKIKKAIADFRDTARMHAVRQILAATTGVNQYILSSKPSDYPASKYDAKWFGRITRQAILPGSWSNPGPKLRSWPLNSNSNQSYYRNDFPVTAGRVKTLRAILDQAGLDEKTATESDLDALDGMIRWTNYPLKKKRQDTHFKWKELILAIESFANRARGKARGHVPNIVVDLGEEEEEEDEDVAASVETGTDAADDSDDE